MKNAENYSNIYFYKYLPPSRLHQPSAVCVLFIYVQMQEISTLLKYEIFPNITLKHTLNHIEVTHNYIVIKNNNIWKYKF